MTEAQLNEVFDILVSDCGAIEYDRFDFVLRHMAGDCREYRCCGALGFGGKFYIDRFQVDGYQEDMTHKRKGIRDRVNAKLNKIKQEWIV